MIARLAALILLSAVHLIPAAEVPPKISLTVVKVGGSVTLKCPVSKREDRLFQWFKLPLGYMLQKVAEGTYNKQSLNAQFNNSRFSVREEEAHYSLSISNVNKEDEATYFCQTGSAYSHSFVNGIFLAVNGRNLWQSVKVRQSPETASVQPGKSVTLQCSLLPENNTRDQCPDEHSVYWFRSESGETPPGFIYTHSNSSDKQEERSCSYSLSKTIRNASDSGTYYCAVVTCGKILFGEGTKVETRSELDPVVLVLGALLACCVTVIIVLIFFVNQTRVCQHCKGAKSASSNPGQDMSTVDQSADLENDTDAVNYAALHFSKRKVERVKKTRESPQECVYSGVRVDKFSA